MKKIIVIGLIFGIVYFKFFKSNTIKVLGTEYQYEVEFTGGASSSNNLPMIIALHGNGDTPKHFYETSLKALKSKARVILVRGLKRYGTGFTWPYKREAFIKYGPSFSSFVRILTHKYKSKGKPILFGFSGGAMMAYHQAVSSPEQYSFIFPISGELKHQKKLKTSNQDLVVYSYHGSQDQVISASSGKAASNFLKKQGLKVEYHEFNDGHLGLFTSAKDLVLNQLQDSLAEI